jgi:hypothetical protein
VMNIPIILTGREGIAFETGLVPVGIGFGRLTG